MHRPCKPVLTPRFDSLTTQHVILYGMECVQNMAVVGAFCFAYVLIYHAILAIRSSIQPKPTNINKKPQQQQQHMHCMWACVLYILCYCKFVLLRLLTCFTSSNTRRPSALRFLAPLTETNTTYSTRTECSASPDRTDRVHYTVQCVASGCPPSEPVRW